MGMVISCSFIFIAMIFWVVNYYLNATQDLDYKVWDVNTVTASDLTISWNITEANWRLYRE